MGGANLGIAAGKSYLVPGSGGDHWLNWCGHSGSRCVWAGYGTVSITCQVIAGGAQIYSAVTGNDVTGAKVGAGGEDLGWPCTGLGTLAMGRVWTLPKSGASRESFAASASSLIEEMSSGIDFGSALTNHSTSYFGTAAGGNPCGGGHER